MDVYEQLREDLPEEVTLAKVRELMQVSTTTLWYRMRFQQTPSHPAHYDHTIKLVNRDDVIALLKVYRVLG